MSVTPEKKNVVNTVFSDTQKVYLPLRQTKLGLIKFYGWIVVGFN